LDAGKSFLGIGGRSASSKLTADIIPIIKSGVGDGITAGLDAAKPSIVKSAQGLFSGSGGLMSIFQKGFGGVTSIAQKAIGGLGSIFGNISTTLGGTKLFSGIAGIFKGIGRTVTAAVGTAGGTGVAGTIAAAVSHIPVIGTILLGGTLAVGAIGGGSFTNGLAKIGSTIGKAVTGIGKTLGKIVKSIGKTITKAVSGIGKFLFGGTSSDGTKKRGLLGTIGHIVTAPIRWVGKLFGFAKGTKKVEKAGTYNVDEEGEEIIVRSPEKGRLTQLEKGDGVVPAKQTATLMGIAKNPIGWVKNIASKIPSSRNSAASSGYTTITSVPQAHKNTAIDSKVDEVVEAVDDIRDDNKTGLIPTLLSKSVKTLGGLNLKFTTFADKTKSTINSAGQSSSVSKWFDIIKNIGGLINSGGLIKGSISEFFGFGNSSTGNPLDNLISSSKSNTLAQLDSMKSQFEKTWKDMAKEVGLSDDQIDATSKEMYSNMQKLVKDTYAAIGDNTALNAEQVEGITKKLFQSMQNTYTAGFNKMASMTDEMSESNANKMANSFNSMKDSCSNAMNSISSNMKNSWNQCGGGIRNLSAKTQSTISKAWADTTGDTEKMLYDMRACFDNSWGMAESGVRDLANNTQGAINGAYSTIESKSEETLNKVLPDQMANAWKNVELGATNLSENIKWVMGKAYDSITKSCDDTISSIRDSFGTIGNDLYNKGQTTPTTKNTTSNSSTSSSSLSSGGGGGGSGTPTTVSGGKSLLELGKDIYEVGSNAISSAKNAWNNSWLGGKVNNAVSGLVTTTKGIASNVKEKWDNSTVGSKVNNAISSTKDKITNSSAWKFGEKVVGGFVNGAKNLYNTATGKNSSSSSSSSSNTSSSSSSSSSSSRNENSGSSSKSSGGSLKEKAEKAVNKIADAGKSFVNKLIGKKASGSRSIQKSGKYNVDEQGSELLVRQPQAGRYTYLETGDGVVPADITSRLFEMGGNPDAWFQDQMSKYGTTSLSSNGGSNIDISIGDIVIQNPVGGAEDLANEIVRNLPNKLSQKMNKRN
jgi:hypothetical protein